MRIVTFLGTLSVLSAFVQPASAQTGPTVQVDHAWARATASASQAGAAYFTITATAPDELTAASTPVAQIAQLHQSRMNNGMMEMRSVPSLAVTPGHPVTLAPGGYHMMLMGLKQPLKAGDHFPLTLTFAHAGTVATEVTVERAGASQAPSMDGMHNMSGMKGMDMDHMNMNHSGH